LSHYQVGCLVDFSVESIQEKLKELYDQGDFYDMIKENCTAARSNWTWEKESMNVLEIYRNVGE